MYCTNCGQESNQKICHSCGVKSNKTHNFCAWCGAPIKENASICTNCGEQVNINKIPLILKIAHTCLIVLFLMFSTVAGGGSRLCLILAAVVLFPFADRVVKKATHSIKGSTPKRVLGYTGQMVLSCTLFVCAILFVGTDTGVESPENEPANAPVDAIDEAFKNWELYNSLESDESKQFLKDNYCKNFQLFFSPAEYVDLYNTASEISATPTYAISKFAVVAHQNIATYNTSEDKYFIMDISGNIIRDYGDNSWVNTQCVLFGENIFINTNGHPAKYDIVNAHGELVNTFEDMLYEYDAPRIENLFDLGDGYYIFSEVKNTSTSSYKLYILNPNGEHFELEDFVVLSASGYHKPYYFDMANMEDNVSVGKISEDLFYFLYKFGADSFACYYDTEGELVINLSNSETNFEVTQLGNFVDGKANIKFRGADYKSYTATIDTTGDFIGEPVSQ